MSELQMPKKRTGQTSARVEDSVMKSHNFVGTPIDTVAANADQQRRSVSSPISPVAVVSFMTHTDGETPQTTPVRIEYSLDQLDAMQNDLANARDTGEFPRNTLNYTGFTNLIQDYQRLQHLQHLRRGLSPQKASQEWRTAFVDTARELADRDAANAQQARDARIENNVHGIIERENQAADSYNMRLHTAVQAVRLATGNAQSNGVNMAAILDEVRTAIQNMGTQGTHGVQGVDMEAVCEEIFGIVESSMLDAIGPLRLNNRLLDQNANRLDQNANRLDQNANLNAARLGGQLDNMTTQVSALNNHVSAVGNHVSALGSLIHAVNTTSMSTNTQMGEVSTQIRTLQQVLNLLPFMIEEAVRQVLPQAIHTTLATALQARAKGLDDKSLPVPAVYNKEMNGNFKSSRKPRKLCFLSRIFGTPKKGDHKNA